jgi:hypothetical protein
MAEQAEELLLDVGVADASKLCKLYLISFRPNHRNFELPGPASVLVGPMEYLSD